MGEDRPRRAVALPPRVSALAEPTPEAPKRRSLYGRSKGKPLRSHQAALVADVLPTLEVDAGRLAAGAPLFGFAPRELWLEIGFGGGEHLVAQALAHPDVGVIGCEPFLNGVAKALAAIDEHKLANVRLHHGDASELLDWLPAGALTRIDLLYPDPWPKRRHWKRRFIQDDSLKRLARSLKSGGELRFATDIADYAVYALARVLRSPDFVWTAEGADDWCKAWPDFSGSRYEAKAKREGRTPAYFVFRKV